MGMCIVSAASGFIIRRTGNYVFIIWGGMVVATTGFGLFIDLPNNKNLAKIIIYQAIAGVRIISHRSSPFRIFNNAMESQQPKLESLLGQDLAQKFSGRNASSNVFTVTKLRTSKSYVVRRAYAKAITTMYIFFAVLSGVGLLASLFIKQKQMSREHKEHKTGLQNLMNRLPNKQKSRPSQQG
ncbi:unnamed protein product [Clonostachys rosea f. rosea IK726]|uniref:Major facilitator superfamily (MFS) profile domain-containing protein n=2 Tax=Bionectria ochroleuca TaxID=29856 RepID=A0A0B7K9N8_BIOOC|nr:unnamed protein product [Clonostachys rosea f. rosea IK726]